MIGCKGCKIMFVIEAVLELTSHGIIHYLWSADPLKSIFQLICQYLLYSINS